MEETKGMDWAHFWLGEAKKSALKGEYTATEKCVEEGRRCYRRSLKERIFGCIYWNDGNAIIKKAYSAAAFRSLRSANKSLDDADLGNCALAMSNAKWQAREAGIDIGADISELKQKIER